MTQNIMDSSNEFVGRLSNKTRVEFSIPAERCNSVTNALEEAGLESLVYEAKSCGCKMPKRQVSTRRGTATIELSQPPRRTIVTIVDSQKVKKLMEIVMETAGRDTSAVAVSPVYEMASL